MAELTKIILRSEDDELFLPQNYKVHPEILDGPLWPSLDKQPSLTDIVPLTTIKKINENRVVGIHYEGETKSISEINSQGLFDSINFLRDVDVTYRSVSAVPDPTLEYIPEHPHILEQIEKLERMPKEYQSKLEMLTYLVDNLFDTTYATNMYMVGRSLPITLNGDVLDIDTRVSGYIKVENADPSIFINFVMRGVPVPFRKTLTSENTDGTNNYIFTYPQYLMMNIDMVQAIQYIEVLNPGSAEFFYGTNYDFEYNGDFTGFGSNLANIHIINKDGRNLYTDPETNI